tara:strand:- start:68 stop:364 length:297 start_codon:yes stop_codon:yes gene_type:complete
MSVTSTNSATYGCRKVKPIPKESKKVFLDTAKTIAIRKGSIARLDHIEGRVLFVGDKINRGLDGRKLSAYLTICFNEESHGAICVFEHDWGKVEVIEY